MALTIAASGWLSHLRLAAYVMRLM